MKTTKLIAAVLSLLTAGGSLGYIQQYHGNIEASAEEVEINPYIPISYTEGDYTYYIYDNEAGITDYTGKKAALVIPSSVRGIPVTKVYGNYSFTEHSEITSVVIPDNITLVGQGCFKRTNITSVSIGKGLEKLPAFIFEIFCATRH